MVVRRNLIGWVWSIIYLTEFQPTPTPSNPQHNPERPTQPREPDPHHSQQTERDSERGERVRLGLDGLERETGGQGWVWRLTDRSSGREEREKRGGRLLGVGDFIEGL